MTVPSLMEQLAKSAVDAREAARDAHTAARDARNARRELRDELARLTREAVTELIEAEARRQIEHMGSQVKHQIDVASRKVMREFDTLSAPLYETLGLARRAVEAHVGESELRSRDRVAASPVDVGHTDWTLKCEFCSTKFSDDQPMSSIQVHFQLLHPGKEITLVTDWRGDGPPPLRNSDLLRLIKKSSNL